MYGHIVVDDMVKRTIRPFIENLLKGYLFEMEPDLVKFSVLLEDVLSMDTVSAFRSFVTCKKKFTLSQNTCTYGNIWKHMYDLAAANTKW